MSKEVNIARYHYCLFLIGYLNIFEKLMYHRLKSFLGKNDILFKSRYSFRENHSTQHAIIGIVNVIQNNMDQNLFSRGIFLDLKKAFDTVDHLILLQKRNHYGINDWFASYLLGRSQVTEVGFNLSTEYMISCGVPQGSLLGPLLFLIYINDIHNSSAKLSFYLFADDTNLLYADTNLKYLVKTVNSELLRVSDWLNAKKSNYVIFRQYGKKHGND